LTSTHHRFSFRSFILFQNNGHSMFTNLYDLFVGNDLLLNRGILTVIRRWNCGILLGWLHLHDSFIVLWSWFCWEILNKLWQNRLRNYGFVYYYCKMLVNLFFFEDDWNFKSFHKKAAHGYIIPVPHFLTENGNWIFILPLAR